MTTSTALKALGLAVGLLLPASAALAQRPTLEQVLGKKELWGKDFPAVVGSLPGWQAAGESQVIVLPAAVASSRSYRTRTEAQRALGVLTRRLAAPLPRLKASFEPMAAPAAEAMRRFRAEVVPLETKEKHGVIWTADSAQFIAPDLTAKKVEDLLGPPESVSTELLQTEKDRRPEVLTLRKYARGAVAFADSDMSPVPGGIGRVILSVPAASRAVFRR